MVILKMCEQHIEQCCKIHYSGLPEDFLPSMGMGFLKSLYRGMIDNPYSMALVDEEDGLVNGFVIGATDTKLFFRHILRKKLIKLCLRAIPAIIKKPSYIKKIFESFFYPDKKNSACAIKAELIIIAVDKKNIRQGSGRKLVESLSYEMKNKNIRVYKVVVYADNDSANCFYKSVGFLFVDEGELYGKKSNIYKYTVN